MAALTRIAKMLTLIPLTPKRITSRALARRLQKLGFRVHFRTIQRDLVALASELPLITDTRRKPYRWAWQACPWVSR